MKASAMLFFKKKPQQQIQESKELTEQEINETISKNLEWIHEYLISRGFVMSVIEDIVNGKYIFKKYSKGHIETRIYMDEKYKIPCEETVLIGEDGSTLYRWWGILCYYDVNIFAECHDNITGRYETIKNFGAMINK